MDKCGNSVFFKDGKLQYKDDNGNCYELIIANNNNLIPGPRGKTGPSGAADGIYVDIFNDGANAFTSVVSANATLPVTYNWDVSSALGLPVGTFFEMNNGATILTPLVDISVNGDNTQPSASYSITPNAINAGLVKLTVTDADGRIARDYRMVFSLIEP